MNNNTIQIKVKQRLNKLDSKDYDNLEAWMIQEAFNKAQVEWVRRQIHGGNQYREGNEQTIRRVDDLQHILIDAPLVSGSSNKLYFESTDLPKNFFEHKRVSMYGNNEDCGDRRFKLYLGEEANVDFFLGDEHTRPDFAWAETFYTYINNKIRIYTDSKFNVSKATLTYYRQPIDVKFANVIDLETGTINSIDVECEFKNDIVELIIDEAASILAGDIESQQMTRLTNLAERNN